ncbi:amino acid adenylation domain-containing protein [Chloroflexi bacterium TSY]|nr:amino acid adenylation domain-containing protein [Chloroflexi bacterium TSY]
MKKIEDVYTLSPLQQGILFHTIYEAASVPYVESLRTTIQGELDCAAFERAWSLALDRHSVLRTAFVWEGADEPHQVVFRQLDLPLEQLDWRDMTPDAQEAALQERLQASRQQGFELSQAPLMNITLIQMANERHELIWNIHHLLLDGWSAGLLLREIMVIYESYCQGIEPPPSTSRPYRDYIVWLQEQDQAEAEAFWRQTLRGFAIPTQLELGPANMNGVQPDAAHAVQKIELSTDLTEKLSAFARQHHLTLNTVLQGAWAILLSRYAGTPDVLFGAVVSGRPTELVGAELMIGMFINTLPVRVQLDSASDVPNWLQTVQEQQATARRYEYSSLTQVHGWSEVPRNLPLFESIVVFENLSSSSNGNQPEGRVAISSVEHVGSETGYPLTVVVEPRTEMQISIYHDVKSFDADTITRMLGHLQMILTGMVEQPTLRPQELPLLTDPERQQILTDWTDTKTDYPRTECVQKLFEAQVGRTPDAEAIVFADQKVTYAELNRRANQLAHHLRAHGVEASSFVGICMERSVELVVGILGILKAGATYVPLDPTYPQERLAFMMDDVDASVIVLQSSLRDHLPTRAATLLQIDTEWDEIAQQANENLGIEVTGEHPAYVMYTSGSTGRPKGISIPHRAINRLVFNTNYIELGPETRMAMVSNTAFDAATLELWGALLHGGCLVGVSKEVALSPHDFADTIRSQRIDTFFLTTALFNQMARVVPDAFCTMHNLLVGGEALDPHWIRTVLAGSPPRRLLNGYGPTESTTFSAWYEIAAVAEDATTVPIGRALSNTQLYVLDSLMQPVPIGVAGELFIGGDGLAHGYVNRPALTADRFVPNPFSDRPGERLYRTGDLVRYQHDGAIEFIGRIDFQVKIRGFRIELGEIESALSQHPTVQEAIVLVREDRPGDKRIVAYIVFSAGSDAIERELRSYLQERLPDYMVPSAFVMLAALPINPNGKVDRKALPAPEQQRALSDDFVAPSTPVEEMLASIWASVLNVERVSLSDNFFDLGGHSLLATQAVSRIQQTFQVNLPLRDLFESTTVRALAEKIEAIIRTEQGVKAPPIVPVDRERELPLSFAQQRLWFMDQLEPGNAAYNIPIALQLTGTLNVEALQASLNELVQRHEGLRTYFGSNDGRPSQMIADALDMPLVVGDLSKTDAVELEQQVRALATAEATRGFDLSLAPLFRVRVLKLAEQTHIVLFTMHHIISDEWSLRVLITELATLYEAFSQDQPAALEPLPIQYADFAHWQRQWLQGEVLEQQLTYWQQQLSGALPSLALPFDRPHPQNPTYAGALAQFTLSTEVSSKLIALSRQEGATQFMTLLAALQTLLYRYTDQEDIIVGTDVANRNQLETEGLIGFFVNHLVLRTDLSGRPTFRQLLKRVKEVTLGAYAHQDLPYDHLVGALQPERARNPRPLFEILFVYSNQVSEEVSVPGLTISPVENEFILAKYDLALFVNETNEGLYGIWRYGTELFDDSTIRRLSKHLDSCEMKVFQF